jgi:4-hydroxybenzoate polyprenyltransferase
VWNDITDRDLDGQVARTRGRPLPSGRVSVRAAAVFGVLLAGIGLAVLLQFNQFTVVLGLISLVPVAIYPFMKRVTSYPQFVLGLAFAWGGLMGWAAATGALAWPAVLAYLAAIAWTIGYDTIYAMQDLEDDAIVGIRSTARHFGGDSRFFIAVCYLAAVVLLGIAGVLAGGGPIAALGLAAFAFHLRWQVRSINAGDSAHSLALFKSNRNAGLILFAGLCLDAAFTAGILSLSPR